MRHPNNGDFNRSEGRKNYPYGARPGVKPTLGNLLRRLTRTNYVPKQQTVAAAQDRAFFEARTRDELRSIAKTQGHTGYGKLNKAALVELVSS